MIHININLKHAALFIKCTFWIRKSYNDDLETNKDGRGDIILPIDENRVQNIVSNGKSF